MPTGVWLAGLLRTSAVAPGAPSHQPGTMAQGFAPNTSKSGSIGGSRVSSTVCTSRMLAALMRLNTLRAPPQPHVGGRDAEQHAVRRHWRPVVPYDDAASLERIDATALADLPRSSKLRQRLQRGQELDQALADFTGRDQGRPLLLSRRISTGDSGVRHKVSAPPRFGATRCAGACADARRQRLPPNRVRQVNPSLFAASCRIYKPYACRQVDKGRLVF